MDLCYLIDFLFQMPFQPRNDQTSESLYAADQKIISLIPAQPINLLRLLYLLFARNSIRSQAAVRLLTFK